MSRISKKARFQKNLSFVFIAINALADTQKVDEIAKKFLLLFEDFKKQRYFISRSFIFKFNWISDVLSILSNDRFKCYVRMNRDFLRHVVDLIQNNFVFHNQFNVFQTSVENQLLYALYKLEHDDSASEFHSSTALLKVSKEHVFDCIKWIVEILCRLEFKYIKWFDAQARTRESLMNNDRQKNFIETMNKIDETNIVLSTKSRKKFDDKLFFNWKKRYVMNLCAVCDSNKRFIFIFCEWSNSQHDQRIFLTENLFQISKKFFLNDRCRSMINQLIENRQDWYFQINIF